MGGAPEMFGMIGLSGITGFCVALHRNYKQKDPKKPKIAYLLILIIGGLLAGLAVITESDWGDKNYPMSSFIIGTIIFSFFILAGYYPGYLVGQYLEIRKDD